MIQKMLLDFFCKPIQEYSGYNPVNTIVYAAVLIVVAFFLIFPFFEKRGIKFNLRFMLAVLPFVVLGSSMRILEDLKIFPRSCNPLEWAFYTISPGIYIAVGLLAVAALIVSIALAKRFKKDSLLFFGSIGTVLALPFFIFDLLHLKVLFGFVFILFLASAITAIAFFAFKKSKSRLLEDRLNIAALFGQMLDASATFTALQFYNCSEQHFVPAFLIESAGAWSFVAVKLALILLILHYVDKEVQNKNLSGFIKVIIAILGFATGTRDLLSVGVGVCL